MLTTGLERAIQKGMAFYKTFALGGSGVGTIPVSKNKFIVIIDFTYFPFVDQPPSESPEDFVIFLQKRSVYQLVFQSKTSQNHYIIRNPIRLGDITELSTDPIKFDTYLVHEANVQIDIVNVPNSEGWITTFATLPSLSQELPLPVGYGILGAGLPAVRKIDFSPTQEYLPLTKKRDNIATTNYREQFRADVNAANALNNIFTQQPNGNYSYPILNVSYVEFNVPRNQFVQASN